MIKVYDANKNFLFEVERVANFCPVYYYDMDGNDILEGAIIETQTHQTFDSEGN